MKSSFRRGDEVLVITGDDKGKSGKILKVFSSQNKVIVSNVAVSKKHVKKSQDNPDGAIVSREMPIHRSNVVLKSKFDARSRNKHKNA